ncbi:DUF1134 domain-containing protein [Hyphomicrobium sp.]|uniref:DUF1134 domain-containing protein n=1 Tax=Hyphomicrobium sp. TaxID=82 RepID=UPI002E322FED|nr:DUF1134 domain-containing protein [Hyphomicrobium sp.]HEX2840253.1 DUF1134 domain-containing protein [Hyphomicrobium sp.]
MITIIRPRRSMIAAAALLSLAALPAAAQENPSWNPQDYRSGGNSYSNSGGSYGGGGGGSYPAPNDSYGNNGSSGNSGGGGYPSSSGGYGGSAGYSQNGGNYGSNDAYTQSRNSYGSNSGDAHSPNRNNYGGNDAYAPSRNSYGNEDAYSPSANNGYGAGGDAYSPTRHSGGGDRYTEPGQPTDPGGYGAPYAPPPADGAPPYADAPPPNGGPSHYEQNEIIAAGHGFFGAISQNLAQAVEYAFKSQGRPNGYILGEDAGGAFVVGLRYGEGRLYTKDAGDHKVFWQGPSLGYDAGAEGSKAMVLVYNLRDPSEIYNRFGGVQGSAYLIGGLSVQFQKYDDVTLAVIRSGVGVRLGANVGYLKYTRAPTWNPL